MNNHNNRPTTSSSFSHWLLYRSWLSPMLRVIFTRGFVNHLARWWYTSRISRWRIKRFIRRHAIDMSQYIVPPNGYQNFNDFFTRKLVKHVRTLDKTAHTVCSPADGSAFVIPHLTATTTFYVKEQPFSLAAFVGSRQHAADYHDGAMLIIRLAMHDYHRFHMPVAGYVHELSTIGGHYESTTPSTYHELLPLLTNRRRVFEVKTAANQKLLIVAVGGFGAGSIESTYNRNTNYLLKGSELGYFAFGGSTLAIITPPRALSIRNDIINNSINGAETAVQMGTSIGRWSQTPTLDTTRSTHPSYSNF